MDLTIIQHMNKKVVVVDGDTPCQFVARAMRDKNIGCVVIAENDNHIAGIVTDRDICCNLVADNLPAETPVREIMTEDVQIVDEDADLEEILNIMEFHGIRRIPVVSFSRKRHPRCVGIVSLDDLLMEGLVPHSRMQDLLAQQILDRGTSELSMERSRARREHKYNLFRKRMAERVGLEAPLAEIIYKELLSEIVQRLPLTGATQFLSQLPANLQDELLNVPVGPNREITAETLLNTLHYRTNLEEEDLVKVIQEMWQVLGELTSWGELEHTLAQLPNDFVRLLTGQQNSRFAS